MTNQELIASWRERAENIKSDFSTSPVRDISICTLEQCAQQLEDSLSEKDSEED